MKVDADELIGVFMRSVLGHTGRKRASKAANFLGGQKGFLTASTLLAGVGLAWGIYDSVKGQNAGAAGPWGAAGVAGAVGAAGLPAEASAKAGAAPQAATVPPIPGAAADLSALTPHGVPADLLRIIRLAVSAARADGTLSAAERALILGHARDAGFESLVEVELAAPQPLAAIVAGVDEEVRKHDLYILAFTIVRADESVTGAERIYLAQLAHQLGLDPATVARLESETAADIDAATSGTPEAES
ncbi:MAG: DUF533 domain-containing protein [Vicinamibacterales bacterium]|nr:DUF533 domain-containing protein [Vicinamibacterales bacterium]